MPRISIRFLARVWYYFRTGYSLYLSFPLSVFNTIVIVYYLLVPNVVQLQLVFSSFVIFLLVAALVAVPVAVGFGWIHMKRSPAYTSEMDISVEANPYYYKLPPGYTREAYAPLYLELLQLTKRLLEAQNLLTPDDRVRIEELERKMRTLIQGGQIGTPS